MRPTLRRSIFLGKVWLLTAAVRLALWVLPFATVQRLVRRWGRPEAWRAPAGSRRPEAIVWAVRNGSRFVPLASCLTQALVAQVLLCRAGYLPTLRIGVAHGADGDLHAHAWVENMGEVVIGSVEQDRFIPLPAVQRT